MPLRVALGLATALALAAIVIGHGYQSTRVFLMSGQPSPETIRAPHTATYVDERSTEQLRDRAQQWVTPVVVVRPEAIAHAENEVAQLFALLVSRAARGEDPARVLPQVSPPTLAWLESQSADKLILLAEPTKQIVREAMRRQIPDEADKVQAAREAAGAAAAKLALKEPAREIVAAVAQRAVRPNLGYNAAATEDLRRDAARSVRPVEKTVVAGEVIVCQGEIAGADDIDALRAVGLLSALPNVRQMLAIIALCALAVVGLAGYVRVQQPHVYEDTRLLVLTALIGTLALFAVNLVNLRGPRAELLSMLSVTAGVMIIAVLVGNRIAVMVAVVASLLVGVMAQGQLALTVLTFGSSLTGVLLVRHIWPPSQLVGASALLGAVNLALVLLVSETTGGEHVVSQAWHGLFYGLGAPALAVGGIFLLQRPFDIATYMRLLELSNPNEPLRRRMLNEAPGSYVDSFLVANLAEAGAEAIGADGLLARVGSYYHDLGKLRRPYLFTENQALLGIGNVHEQLSPSLSSLVITSHVKDGAEFARQCRLPRVVRDIIAQHHGTTLVSFFYHQACSDSHGQRLPEDSFRYPGPKPATREAALVMLADATFAAVWSLPDKTPARVETVVRQIARERLEDGQLDECPLTLRDLSAITDAFLRLLKGIIFHTRVEYPQLAEAGARRTSGHPHHDSPRPRRQ
jgi:putative nucleotidyltransferase with HDIG domain